MVSGCDKATVLHKPRLLSDNGSSCISGDLAKWLGEQAMDHVRGAPTHPQTQGKIEPLSADLPCKSPARQWMAPNAQKPHSARKLRPARRTRTGDRRLRRPLQSPPLSQKPRQSDTGRSLLRSQQRHANGQEKNKGKNNETATLAQSRARRIKSQSMSQAALNALSSIAPIHLMTDRHRVRSGPVRHAEEKVSRRSRACSRNPCDGSCQSQGLHVFSASPLKSNVSGVSGRRPLRENRTVAPTSRSSVSKTGTGA